MRKCTSNPNPGCAFRHNTTDCTFQSISKPSSTGHWLNMGATIWFIGILYQPLELKILLWNTEGNKQALQALLEEAQYDLLAIQEPWINKQTKSTYCPRGSKYHLVHFQGGRAAIFVSRKFEIGQ